MAESGEEKSLASGSEPVYDFYCEFCYEDGLHKEAEGHCTECDEDLCRVCIIYHKRNRSSRHHEISIVKGKMPVQNRIRIDISTMCKEHKGEPVEYYCNTHDKLTCRTCFISEHRSCKSTVNIVKYSSSIFNGKEYKDFIQTLNLLETQVHDISTRSREQKGTSVQCCIEAIESAKHFKNEIISVIYQNETGLKTQVDDIKTKDVAKMEIIENTCSTIQEVINQISSELKHLKSENRECQAYIRMKEAAVVVKNIEQKLVEADNNNTINTYTFVPNIELTEILKRQCVLGLLSVSKREEKIKNRSTSSEINSVSSASFIHDINVSSIDTERERHCAISGSAMLSSNKLVVVDYHNDKVKIVDTFLMTIISELHVTGVPWDVTAIREDQVAVTDSYNNTILILKIADSISIEREVKVSGDCRGIDFIKNQLIVTFVNPPYIEIMDVYGNVSSKLEFDKDDNKLLKYPEYVCVSSNGETLYVSDYNAQKVVSLGRDGSVKAVYTDSNLRRPRKICLDHRGNVFVCGYWSNEIHMITPDCSKIKVILTLADGLTSHVDSVSHCRQTDRLYVGMRNCDKVKVYQLS